MADAQEQVDDVVAAALAEAQGQVATMQDAVASVGGSADSENTRPGIDLLGDVELDVSIELGRTEMLVEDVLKLGNGSVIELDKLAGDPVDVYVNHRLVARGEVLVLNDNFCIRISEIIDDLDSQELLEGVGEVAEVVPEVDAAAD